MKLKYYLVMMAVAWGLMVSCADDESFSVSSSHLLTFSTDTVHMDTVFSSVPSATRSFWVYNRSDKGLRLKQVRLAGGGVSGFRVNVDGTYLGEETMYGVSDVEIRGKDSVRVFVEVTPNFTCMEGPQEQQDDLVFSLESGVEQRVNLSAYAWDATLMRNVHISRDSTIDGRGRPIVVYGGVKVDSAATLTLAAGTTLYFHEDAGMHVYGRLIAEGRPDARVVLRGDRIDRMFDYLPYDRVSGQWQGLHFDHASTGNVMQFADVRNAYDGVVVDSSDVSREKLLMEGVTVHNCQGYGVHAVHARLTMNNTQVTNTLHDCVYIDGGQVTMNNCTLAQFYPFDAERGGALRLAGQHPLLGLEVNHSLLTGYAANVLFKESPSDSTMAFVYRFANCMIRTPKVETADSVNFVKVVYELAKDTVGQGEHHFKTIDTDQLRYDFDLDSVSVAIDKGDKSYARPVDHEGRARDDKPDIGAYEYVKP